MARKRKYDETNGSIGLSKKAQQALDSGTYGQLTDRTSKYRTSQEQAQQFRELPVLEGLTRSNDWQSSLGSINTDRARQKYAERINYTPLSSNDLTSNDENYVVKRDRYSKLMKDNRLANDIRILAEVNYKNANQDATVSQDWADEYGAKKITGGMSKQQYIDTLSRRYGLTAKELNDMALTFHSDAYKQETEDYGKSLEKIGKDMPVLGSAGSFVGTLGSGIEGAYNTAVGALTNDDRFLSNIFRTTKESPREGAKQNIDSNVGKTVYDVAMGIGDMGVGAAAGSAPVILAGNTMNTAQKSAMDRGSSTRRSSVYAAGAGALDFITNKVGLDKAKSLAVESIKGTGIKQFLQRNALAGAGEGLENVLQDIGQTFVDNIVNENSELGLLYDQKKAQGMSNEKAFAETAKDYGKQLLASGAIGFGMGSAMQAGRSIIPSLTNRVSTESAEAEVPKVTSEADIQKAQAQQTEAVNSIRELADQIPEGWTVDDLENATRDISNVAKPDIAPSIHNADGKLLDTVKVPEYTADSNVFFEGTDTDISLAEAQDKSIIDTFKNIVSDPEFNALSFKNGKQEVFVSPSTSGNGYRVSYTIDGVPTGHHDYSVEEMDALSQNLRELAGNGGEDIRIQRKSDISRTQGTTPAEEVPNLADNTKVSQAYTNTGKNGGGWNEAEYDRYTDPSQFLYETIDETESVERASAMRRSEGRDTFKSRVLDKERVSSVELDGLMMEWRELTEEARALEAMNQDASDLWSESIRIFRKVQEQSTDNAQALQALAKWSRNTPEGMLIQAENIVNGKTKVPQTELQKIINKVSKKNGDFHFSDEFAKEFLEKAEEIKNLSDEQLDTPFARQIMAELGRKVNEQIPAKFGEKVMSFLMDNMLGNFRTLITRNAGGNLGLNMIEQVAQRPLAAAIDRLVAKKTGTRTQVGLSRDGLNEYLQGFAKGIKDELSDFKTGLVTARSGENTLQNAIRANRHVFSSKPADFLDGLVKHGLSFGDRPFYESVFNQTLGDYQRLRSTGQMGDIIQNMSDEDFNKYARTAANLNALSAVYQQDSKLATSLLEFKQAVGDLSRGIIGEDILSQFSMPFVKTPANVIERAVDYSPLGIVRNALRTRREIKDDNFNQNRFVNEASRNILGTALMGAGAVAANNGLLSGSYSDDTDEKQAQKESGMQEYALNLPGNLQIDISWIPVLGSNTVAAAAAVDAANKSDGNTFENLATGIKAGGQSMFNQSMFQGLQRLFGTGEAYNTDEGILGNIGNVVKQGFGQAIPSLLRQTTQVADTYQRDLGNSNEGKSFLTMDNYDLNSLANNIPGLRQNVLAPKVDTSGNLIKENQGRSLGSKIIENMILPGKISKVTTNTLAEEAKRLSDITDEKTAYMPKAKRRDVDTENHILTNKEWTDYQQKYYGELTSAGEKMLNADNYISADAKAQQNALKGVYDSIKQAINSKYNGKEATGASKTYIEAGGGEKGVQAVVDYYNDKIVADALGISVEKYRKEEAENPGNAALYAEDKAKAGSLGLSVDTYRKQEAENPGGAQAYVNDREAAESYGFLKKDGTVNVKAYQDALEYAGNDPQSIEAYSTYRSQGFSKDSERIPYLMNDSSFTNEQKGKIIGGANVDKMGKGAKGAYDIGGYDGVYYYYLVKYLADQAGNQNNDASKSEVIDLLNSNDPNVQQIPDSIYYYLPTVKW